MPPLLSPNNSFCNWFLILLTLHSQLHLHHFHRTMYCSPDELSCLMHNLPSVTACSLDEIPASLLRSTFHSIAIPLSLHFNLSLDYSIFLHPGSTQKSKNLTPILITKYRIIVLYRSLLPIISKLLERHVYNILLDFCLSRNLVSTCQFGFLPQRLTSAALYMLPTSSRPHQIIVSP